jgi:MFS family permease
MNDVDALTTVASSSKDESEASQSASRNSKTMKKNYLRILFLSFYSISYGYYLTIFNPIGTALMKNVYKLSSDETNQMLGNINMLFSIGALGSVLLSGHWSEKIGRRKLIIIYDFLNLVTVGLYWVQDLHVLQAFRFFQAG